MGSAAADPRFAVRGGLVRTEYGEISEALFLNQSFAYETAQAAGMDLRAAVPDEEPLVLRRTIDVPQVKRSRLVLAVSSMPAGRWQLKINAEGRNLHQQIVGGSTEPHWQTISVDLSPLAGKSAKLELQQITLDGKLSAAFWGQVELLSD